MEREEGGCEREMGSTHCMWAGSGCTWFKLHVVFAVGMRKFLISRLIATNVPYTGGGECI